MLALDTSTSQAGIALYDGDLIAELTWPTSRHGSRTLLSAVDLLLQLAGRAPTDLTAIAAALGPGSFSALRVGLSAAKGLSLGLSCPVIGISTLDTVAHPHRACGQTVWAVLEAGRGRLVAAAYAMVDGEWRAVTAARHGSVADIVASMSMTGPALVCGEVTPAAQATLANQPGLTLLPPATRRRRAGALAELAWARLQAGESDDPAQLAPLYLHGGGEAIASN